MERVRRMASRSAFLGLLAGAVILAVSPDLSSAAVPSGAGWPVRVVIVTTFQSGPDIGPLDARPEGELRLWAEREHLTERVDFPGGMHPILSTPDHDMIAIVTGMSLINAGVSIMALGTDHRFDLRKAYWMVAGIAGVDPQVASVGSAAWARYVVNDVAQSIDMREAPSGWPYGIFPNDAKRPNSLNGSEENHGPDADYPLVFTLDAGLARWAWSRTRNLHLPETTEMRAYSARWSGFVGAQQPPKVFLGDSFASDFYWHGSYLNQYARDWVKLFTNAKGVFAMSNMEDSAVAAAVLRLDRMGYADFRRLMVLRTASNYTLPPTGRSAFDSISDPYPDGGRPAYEAAWSVGSTVAHDLVSNWREVGEHIPSAPPSGASGY